jgi:hypothetical protein
MARSCSSTRGPTWSTSEATARASTSTPSASVGLVSTGRAPVAEYVLRRLVLLVPTLVGISVLVFTLVRLLPGDVIDALDPRLRAP